MDDEFDNEWGQLKKWYGLHVRTGLPGRIALGASRLHVTPEEFLEQVVERGLFEMEKPARSRRIPVARYDWSPQPVALA